MSHLPYASQHFVGQKCFATCPECGQAIRLTRKDTESFSMAAYAAHYNQQHVAQTTPPV